MKRIAITSIMFIALAGFACTLWTESQSVRPVKIQEKQKPTTSVKNTKLPVLPTAARSQPIPAPLPPITVIESPRNGVHYSRLYYLTASGYSIDNGNPTSGIAEIKLSIYENNWQMYWDGYTWRNQETWVNASPTWQFGRKVYWIYCSAPLRPYADHSITLRAKARDGAGRQEQPGAAITFFAGP